MIRSTKAIDVACPGCSAPAGTACRTAFSNLSDAWLRDRRTGHHQERIDAAIKQTRDANAAERNRAAQ